MQTSGLANGPAERTDWNTVDWRRAGRIVSNLRRRIFRATQEGDARKLRSLQKLMLRCRSNILMSVRRVTQVNAGKHTPGVDKVVVKTPQARGEMVDRLSTMQPWRAKPVRRVYIPKSNGRRRPLGIPVVMDRILQMMEKNALEPEWEARFEGSSYGFRPGRSCHDAVKKIFILASPHRRKKWIVDADIKGAFDNIDQDYLLKALGDVPGRELIRQWLKAGVIEEGDFQETPLGTPQGGVISPLLLNVALHGMEDALGVKYNSKGRNVGKRTVVRYADDFIVGCESQEDAQSVKDEILPGWLGERGLHLSEEKTRIVHLSEGFDFLGFNIRHYPAPQTTATGQKLLIKPNKEAIKALKEKLLGIWRKMNGQNVQAVLANLNPVIRGWANYHRTCVASETFRKLDQWMYWRAVRYARRTHPTKPVYWLRNRYWGALNPKHKGDKYVFGNKKTGAFLLKFMWFKIERHVLVKGKSSPDDPGLRDYWENRRKVNIRHLSPSDLKIAEAQDWACPVCGKHLMNGETLDRHHKSARADGGPDSYRNLVLVHHFCHEQLTAAWRKARRKKGNCRPEL